MRSFEVMAADPDTAVIMLAVATSPQLPDKVREWSRLALGQPKPAEPPPEKVAEVGVKVAEEKKVVMLEKPTEPASPPPTPPAPASAGGQRELAALKSRLTAEIGRAHV